MTNQPNLKELIEAEDKLLGKIHQCNVILAAKSVAVLVRGSTGVSNDVAAEAESKAFASLAVVAHLRLVSPEAYIADDRLLARVTELTDKVLKCLEDER